MLGIKRNTVNQSQLSHIPTHSLATQIINRGSWKQKRELAQFLNEVALFKVSAIEIVVYSIEEVLRSHSELSTFNSVPLHIRVTKNMNPSDQLDNYSEVELQESSFIQRYFTYIDFMSIVIKQIGINIQPSTVVFLAYLLKEVNASTRMALPCAHCQSSLFSKPKSKSNPCCTLKNNIREILVSLLRFSICLGNNYDMNDLEYNQLMKTMGLACRDTYYSELKSIIINKVNLTFTISIYENYLAEKTIALHLSHYPLATVCPNCKLQRQLLSLFLNKQWNPLCI